MKELANPQVEDSLRDIEVQRCSIQSVNVAPVGHAHVKISWMFVSRYCGLGHGLIGDQEHLDQDHA